MAKTPHYLSISQKRDFHKALSRTQIEAKRPTLKSPPILFKILLNTFLKKCSKNMHRPNFSAEYCLIRLRSAELVITFLKQSSTVRSSRLINQYSTGKLRFYGADAVRNFLFDLGVESHFHYPDVSKTKWQWALAEGGCVRSLITRWVIKLRVPSENCHLVLETTWMVNCDKVLRHFLKSVMESILFITRESLSLRDSRHFFTKNFFLAIGGKYA